MVTTRDIADRVQLAVSTVGRALADDPRISEPTKIRVRQAATELGYVGNRAARMMRGASSNVVGLVIPDIRNSFYITVAHELSGIMAAQDYQLLLAETNDDRLLERRHVRELSASRAAGVVIAPTARPHEESVTLLRGIPHVQLLRKHPLLGSQWFGLDDHRTLRDATTHLLKLGHTRIAYIGASSELPTGQQRLEGYTQALREAGLSRRANLVEMGAPSSIDHGREAARRLLKLPTRPTAIVLGSVQHTIGVLDELLKMGVDVPKDLSVIGFGDESAFGWWGPGLTTISLPISDVAASCGLWFVRRLDNPPEPGDNKPYESVSTGSLVLRGSTAPPPASARKRSA